MLDTWRSTLAKRMNEVLRLPGLPTEVGQAFTELWRLAVTEVTTVASAALERDRNTLFAEQTSFVQERKLMEIAVTEAQAGTAEIKSQLMRAELQLRERQTMPPLASSRHMHEHL
jgi:hypothetical protein